VQDAGHWREMRELLAQFTGRGQGTRHRVQGGDEMRSCGGEERKRTETQGSRRKGERSEEVGERTCREGTFGEGTSGNRALGEGSKRREKAKQRERDQSSL